MEEEVTICQTCKREREQTLVIADHEPGETICGNCGTVITEKLIDQSQEWYPFDAEEFNYSVRTGALTLLARHDMGHSTFVQTTRHYYARHDYRSSNTV
jgi:transcription initiation factor TFIIB